MSKYRKKPIEVEAFQYDCDTQFRNQRGVLKFKCEEIPEWAEIAFKLGVIYYRNDDVLCIKNDTGDFEVYHGDYIIKGIAGEIYPCNPVIFENSYEKVI